MSAPIALGTGSCGYSFRTILGQSSQRLLLNRWPRSGTEPHTRQTHPSARQRLAHASSFLRSESSVLTTCGSIARPHPLPPNPRPIPLAANRQVRASAYRTPSRTFFQQQDSANQDSPASQQGPSSAATTARSKAITAAQTMIGAIQALRSAVRSRLWVTVSVGRGICIKCGPSRRFMTGWMFPLKADEDIPARAASVHNEDSRAAAHSTAVFLRRHIGSRMLHRESTNRSGNVKSGTRSRHRTELCYAQGSEPTETASSLP